jgi:hypothetical protein
VHAGSLAHGADGPTWLPWGACADFASDQRADDGRSLVFDSVPLTQRVEILGEPALEVVVVPGATTGQLVARLCDVAPDGASTLVTFGVLNLCHEGGHAEPRPLVPGEPVRPRVALTAVAYAFPPGHRIRLALAPCYWPWAWPPPGGLLLHIHLGADAVLALPVREPQPLDGALAPLPPPEAPTAAAHEQLAPVDVRRAVSRDVASGRIESESELSYFGSFRLADGLEYSERGRDSFSALEDDPLSAEARSSWEIEIGRDDWRTRVVVESSLRADATAFELEDRLETFVGEEQVCSRRWTTAIPRDLG